MSSVGFNTRSRGTGARQVDVESPWLGLKSFDENNQGFFFGRSQEIEDLRERVLDHRLTVLYGHSGLGKTSLLKAGLIPTLREAGWYPIFVRLAFDEADPTLHAQVIKELFGQLANAGIVTGAEHNEIEELNLWELLHDPALKFIDTSNNSKIKVVLIFDQFEEVWTVGREKRPDDAETLMMLLSALAENRAPLAQQIRLNADDDYADRMESTTDTLRILFSLREDYLHWLERWRPRMPSIMDCRVELRPLTKAKALQAVLEPGKLRVATSSLGPIIDESTALAIVSTAAGIPPLLSLICERLNARRILAGEDYITGERVESRTDDVLREFYITSFDLVPVEVRHFVEDRLVSETGVRESMNIETAERELVARNVGSPAHCLEELVNARILSVDYRGGVSRIELTHDLLTSFAVHYRNLRREEQRLSLQQARLAASRYARLKLTTLGIVFAGLVVTSLLGAYAWNQRDQISQLYEKVSADERVKTDLLIREAKAYSTVGNRNWDEWLATPTGYALPTEPGRTKWHEALANWSHSLELNSNQKSVRERILSIAASTSTAGDPEFTLKSRAQDMWTSPSGRLLALLAENKVTVRSTESSENTLLTFEVVPKPIQIEFDADEQHMLVWNSTEHIDIYSMKTFKLEQTIRGSEIHAGASIVSACFVPTKKLIALSFSDQMAGIVAAGSPSTDIYLFPTVHPLKRQNFSQDGEQLVVFHRYETIYRLSLLYTQEPDRKTPLLNVISTERSISDLFLDSQHNQLIFVSRTDQFSVPYEETEQWGSEPNVFPLFYKFDLSNIAHQDWKIRTRSLKQIGVLPIEYEQLQMSPDGRWLIARILQYSPPTGGCGPAMIQNTHRFEWQQDPTATTQQLASSMAHETTAQVASSMTNQSVQFVSTAAQGTSRETFQNESAVEPVAAQAAESSPSQAIPTGPSHYLLMADLARGINTDSLYHLNSAFESCFFSDDSRLVYLRDSNGCLKAFDLLARQWMQSGVGLPKLDQAKPIFGNQVLARGNLGEIVVTAPPLFTPLLTTFEVPGSVIMLRGWRENGSSGNVALSEDKFDVCFTSLGGTLPLKVDRLNEAELSSQRVSSYDVSGRIALNISTFDETKTVLWYPHQDPATLVLGMDTSVLLSDADRAMSASRSNRFLADLPSPFSQAAAVHHTTSPNGHWLINPFGVVQTMTSMSKTKRYYTDQDGNRQFELGWESITKAVENSHAFTLQYDTELVPTPKAWADCAMTTAEFLPDNNSLAIARTDGIVSIWDLPSLSQRGQFVHTGSVRQLQFSHDGKSMLVVSASETPGDSGESAPKSGLLTVWDVASAKPLFPAIDLVQRAVISSSGKLVLAIDDRTRTPFLIECATGKREAIPIVAKEIVDLSVDLDDRYAFIAVPDRVYRWQIPSTKHLSELSQLALQDVQQLADTLSSLGIDDTTGELKFVGLRSKSASSSTYREVTQKIVDILKK